MESSASRTSRQNPGRRHHMTDSRSSKDGRMESLNRFFSPKDSASSQKGIPLPGRQTAGQPRRRKPHRRRHPPPLLTPQPFAARCCTVLVSAPQSMSKILDKVRRFPTPLRLAIERWSDAWHERWLLRILSSGRGQAASHPFGAAKGVALLPKRLLPAPRISTDRSSAKLACGRLDAS